MSFFLSYSSRDRARLDDLLSAMRRAHEEVWFDEDLGGGQEWWKMILDHIRGCEVFIFALSNNSLESQPCLAELRYAQDLGKPILPLQIGPVESMRVTPLAAVEVVDFQHPSLESGVRLIAAVRDGRERAGPLPSPLPHEPPVPFAHLIRLASTLTDATLDPQQQANLLVELRGALDEHSKDAGGAAWDRPTDPDPARSLRQHAPDPHRSRSTSHRGRTTSQITLIAMRGRALHDGTALRSCGSPPFWPESWPRPSGGS